MTVPVPRRASATGRRPRGAGVHPLPALLLVVSAAFGGAIGWPAAARGQPRGDDAAVAGPAGGEVDFVRVHVPTGRLADVPLGTGRYVPMSAREFAEGVARLAGRDTTGAGLVAPAAGSLATAARYVVEGRRDGGLEGTAEFDVGWPGADGGRTTGTVAAGATMPLAGFDVRAGVMRTAAGTGEAVVFGRRDGTIAMVTPAAGTYGFQFTTRRPAAVERHRLVLPLVPALSSAVVLVVPRGLRPVNAAGDTAATAWEPLDAPGPAEPQSRWRLTVGPRPSVEFELVEEDSGPTAVSLWSDIAILGRQARFAAAVVPATPWREGSLVLEKDPEAFVTSVEYAAAGAATAASWVVSADGRRITVDLPPRLVGRRDPVTLHGAAPIGESGGAVPMVRAPEAVWRSGGTSLRLPPELSAAGVLPEQCVVVSPAAAAGWPLARIAPEAGTGGVASAALPAADAGGEREDAAAEAPRYWLEHQGSRASVRLALVPAEPVFDVARVTTVDLSPAAVTARATCDVRVDRGEAFDLTARVAPQWIIDTVELVQSLPAADPRKPLRRLDPADPEAALDWKFEAGLLRIGLASAAKSGRRFYLRVTGRHPGIPLESDFSTAAIDMVRFDGEAERGALLELRTNPETAVEFEGADPPAPGPDGRLAVLVEDGPVRARAWAGHRAAARQARLVRRRPPLDVRAQVRLTVRDERLTEAFTFDCRPAGSDLDSIVVQLSTTAEEPLAWSLLPPAVGTVSARRLDPPERRAGASAAAAGDRWLVEIAPAARGPVTIRGARTTALLRRRPIPLAWVDGATSTTGEVFVKDVGRSRLSVVNHRLSELPRTRESAGSIAEFVFDAGVAADEADGPAAELVPWAGEPRACAWREVVTSWCHTSGRTEHESVFEIDNHGRPTVLIEVQRGHRLQGVMIDGSRVPLGDGAAASGSVTVELPLGKRLVKLLVRTAVDRPARPQRGVQLAWQVAAVPVRLADIPVLEREWVLLLPPGLEILRRGRGVRLVADTADADDWAGRLFGAAVRASSAAALGPGDDASLEAAGDPPRDGFRRVLLLSEGQGGGGVTVVPSEAVTVTMTASAALAAAAVFLLLRRGRAAALAVLVGLGAGALWADPPFAGVFRVALWTAVAAYALATRPPAGSGRRGGGLAAAVAVWLAALPAAVGAAPQDGGPDEARGPLKVFMMPPAPGGDAAAATVLVPERLFRLLVRGEEPAAAGTRVLATRVVWSAAGDGRTGCRMIVEVDADAGGSVWLDQGGAAARFVPGSCLVDGTAAACRLDEDGRGLWTPPLGAGRHSIDVEIAPAVEQRGDIELATVSIPVAPRAVLEVRLPAAATGAAVCERAGADGVFTVAPRADGAGDESTFDAAAATRVRLVRSRSGARLADGPRAVDSRNDISWGPADCRLVASFAIETGDALLRQVIVNSDEGLEWIPPDGGEADARQSASSAGVVIRPLAAGRHLVEFAAARPGPVRFEMAFRMPLPAPTGVFDLPGAWLDQAAADSRSIRLTVDPALAARAEPPAGFVPVARADGDGGLGTRTWQGDVVRGGQPVARRVRLVTERRPQVVRGAQQQSLVFSAEQVLLRLDARLDAPAALVTLPLEVPAGCIVDRVSVVEEDASQAEGDRAAIDARLSRPSATVAELVFQRPRAGTFRLEIDARLPGRPAPRGELPRLRVRLADLSGTRIDWRTEDALELAVTSAGRVLAAGTSGSVDRAADQAALEYRLGVAEPVAAGQPAAPGPEAEAGRPAGADRVELADVRLALDARGGMWGIVCFELVSTRNPLVLRLPRSWRLFDVSIDGKPAAGLTPVPPPADVADRNADVFWEVRLLDAGWPRSVVALFKGELGSRAAGGEPVELVPPSVVGLATRKVIWTLELPRELRPEVSGRAHLVSPGILAGERRAARERLDADFASALDRASGGDRERLAAFLEARRAGQLPVDDVAWTRHRGTDTARSGFTGWSVSVAGPTGDRTVTPTLRLVGAWDRRVAGRLIATWALVAVAVIAGTRRRASPRGARGEWLALGGLLLGVAWLVWLEPRWPGAVLALWTAGRLAAAWSERAGGGAAQAGGSAAALPPTASTADIAIEVATELHRFAPAPQRR